MKTASDLLNQLNGCVIIPTYNNHLTLRSVLDDTLATVPEATVIVINDGSTDTTSKILDDYESRIIRLDNETNSGKGYSLRKGFEKAIEHKFQYAITIDSDGQHYPADIPLLLSELEKNLGNVVMGSRNMNQEGVPSKSSFGNKFSNFWFALETLISLPDTQTGYRIYPLEPIKKMRFFTRKFEFEIEVIVRLAWKNVKFTPVPISVKYDKEERVSHFRPGRDFFRISVLNSILVIGALFYYYPKRLFSFDTLRMIKEEAVKPHESNLRKAFSIGFGFFMGIFPIWGFQLLIGIPLAVFFRLNKVLFIAAANISIPPMIPFILYASLLCGQVFVAGEVDHSAMLSLSLEDIETNFYQYLVGAIILAFSAFGVSFLLSYTLYSIFRKDVKTEVNQDK